MVAPAKINLFLHVGDKRPDNYHALESLVVFAEAGDRMEFAAAGDLTLKVTGPFARYAPPGADNLVLRAARALSPSPPQGERAGVRGLGATITLEKNIPVAAGLGGGSADAAATLRALNVLWDLKRSEQDLLEIAATLGSDVPACVLSRPCWMTGRGEHVHEVPSLPSVPAVLVNPGIAVPTAPVFAALNARTGIGALPQPQSAITTLWDLVSYLADSTNDLEAPAGLIAPAIDEVLAALDHEPACVLAQMSGSGATCFALFDGEEFAAGAADRIAQDHPDWWVKATRLAAPDIGRPRSEI
ncbi:MAG: 4-(cytidine 5'-diphospho)-2-C-methyl-D-erythritol kinase [Alphaproteobacteria bacterium]|nr:4-(cytidine 5'-diphospho)-2-C-methyl-D-erythritol kinase [Alphaproteobacteria bacterium]